MYVDRMAAVSTVGGGRRNNTKQLAVVKQNQLWRNASQRQTPAGQTHNINVQKHNEWSVMLCFTCIQNTMKASCYCYLLTC